MKTKKFIAVLLVILLACTLCACKPPEPEPPDPNKPPADIGQYTAQSRQFTYYLGTDSILVLFDNFRTKGRDTYFTNAVRQVNSLLINLDRYLNVSKQSSDIYKFNVAEYGTTLQISNYTAEVLLIAKEIYELTDGLYDPTVARLVDLWGFTPRFNVDPEYLMKNGTYDRDLGEYSKANPESKYIEAFTRLVDFSKVVVGGNAEDGYTLTKNCQPVYVDDVKFEQWIDIGGIGKGYAADLVAQLLKDLGYRYGYFNCGNSSAVMLENVPTTIAAPYHAMWDVNAHLPRGELDTFATVLAKNSAQSTSGDYQHNFIINDQVACHFINPHTGYPVNYPAVQGVQSGLGMVTIVGEGAAKADAITTAMMLMDAKTLTEFMAKIDYQVVASAYKSGSNTFEMLTNIPEGKYTPANLPNVTRVTSVDSNGKVTYSGTYIK